ncbi:MAG: MFS transporter, partial [Anaerolineales bacterium]|nr:MFS transporter [Anaerolineales bacterium]
AQIPSILNPFIGYLADRVSVRYFVIMAPAITGTAMSLMGLANSYVALVMLLLAGGVSIAAFHAPAPAMIGRISGKQVGKGMSFFMASGELGRTMGPLAVAGGIELFGVGGLWRLAIVGWIVTAILFVRLRDVAARPNIAKGAMNDFWSRAGRFFLPLALLMLFRNFMMAGLTTYLPIYMTDEVAASL